MARPSAPPVPLDISSGLTQPVSAPGGAIRAAGPVPFDDSDEYWGGKERTQHTIKLIVIILGAVAALYFGGGVLLKYFKTEGQAEALVRNNQEVSELRAEIDKLRNASAAKFQVEIKAVEKAQNGFAYLVVDSFQQPWFVQSEQVLQKGGKVWVSIEPPSHEGNPPNVKLTLSPEGTHGVIQSPAPAITEPPRATH